MVRVGLRKTALPSSFSASTATPSSSASRRNRRLWHMAVAWRVWWLWVENKNWKTLKIGWLRMAHSSQKVSVFQGGKSASAALPKTNLKGDCATMVGILRPTDQPELPAKWRGKFTGFTQTTWEFLNAWHHHSCKPMLSPKFAEKLKTSSGRCYDYESSGTFRMASTQ